MRARARHLRRTCQMRCASLWGVLAACLVPEQALNVPGGGFHLLQLEKRFLRRTQVGIRYGH